MPRGDVRQDHVHHRRSDVELLRAALLPSARRIEEFKAGIAAGTLNPRDVKIWLAKEIIARYHDEAAAEAAHEDFTQRFSKNAIPDDMPEVELALEGKGWPSPTCSKTPIWWPPPPKRCA